MGSDRGVSAPAASLDAQLRAAKPEQFERFGQLAPHFAEVLALAHSSDRPGLIARDWIERNRPLESALLPEPPIAFIRHPSVLHSMFVGERHVEHELPALYGAYDEATLAALLAEDPVGAPPLIQDPTGTITSSNTIHHAHHLWRFGQETGADVAAAKVIVEWGGGYGNLAKLARRVHGGPLTYVIVDTPLFTAVQWLYLSSVLGPEAVVVLEPAERVHPGRVNLAPVGLVEDLDVRADLFVSTWALNESPIALQEHVFSRRWFGAGHLLMGMRAGVALSRWAADGGARVVPIGPWMPGQNYVLR